MRDLHFRGSPKLPKNLNTDGAKWLMVPSKIILDGLSVWPERQNVFTAILHVLCIGSYLFFIYGSITYVTGKNVHLGSVANAISLQMVMVETLSRRFLPIVYKNKINNVLYVLYYKFWRSDLQGKELHEEIKKGSWVFLIYCSTYTFLAFVWGVAYVILPYFKGVLPFSTIYPFEWKESPYYDFLYVWQGVLAFEIAFNVCGLDIFFVGLVYNCVAQFKLLRRHMIDVYPRFVQKNNEEDLERFVVKCIRHHVLLIETCKEINEVFRYFILIQYLTSMGIVCLSSFVVVAEPSQTMVAFTFFVGHISQLLVYCYIGNDLIIESTALSTSIFECGWHLSKYNKKVQKGIVLMMLRAQKPLRISAGGFGFLSLQSFAKLLQFSFSVFTLLNSMMKKQDAK